MVAPPSPQPCTPSRRALVDAPDYTRKIVSFRRLSLTDLKVDIPRLANKKVLKAKLAESGELFF